MDTKNNELNISNKELKETMSKFNVESVDLEDEIDFKCSQCGACCMDREDIILNPYDVYNIAKAKNIKIEEVINEYCISYIGENSYIPIIVLKEDEREMCPFLKFYITEGKFGCSINDNKPGVCMNHPIGVLRSTKKDKLNNDETVFEKRFIKTKPCNNHNKGTPVKIKDFIGDYLKNIESHDLGSMLQLYMTKYVNVKKLVKMLVIQDEEYINKNASEEERNILKKLQVSSLNSTNKPNIIEMIKTMYFVNYIEATYASDLNKSFIEQKEDIKAKIEKAAVQIVGLTGLLGIDVLNPEISNDTMSESAKEETNKLLDKVKEVLQQWEIPQE